MAKKVFFLAGLPRSGSTLLANVLNQNPRFQVTSTSPLNELVTGMKARFTSSPQRMAAYDHARLLRMFRSSVRGAIEGFFPDAEVGIDKAREWMQHRMLLREIYGDRLKVICPVRDLRGCLASQETLYRRAPEAFWQDESIDSGIEQRIRFWMSSNPLGKAGAQIRAALQEGYANNGFIFIRMEDFTHNPQPVLNALYEELGEPVHQHDCTSIKQSVIEHDPVHWPLGEHTLTAVAIKPLREDFEQVLGKSLSDAVVSENQWFYRAFYPDRLQAARKAA